MGRQSTEGRPGLAVKEERQGLPTQKAHSCHLVPPGMSASRAAPTWPERATPGPRGGDRRGRRRAENTRPIPCQALPEILSRISNLDVKCLHGKSHLVQTSEEP